nr:hypothetical protein [uncultured Desulfobulbus sp.]
MHPPKSGDKVRVVCTLVPRISTSKQIVPSLAIGGMSVGEVLNLTPADILERSLTIQPLQNGRFFPEHVWITHNLMRGLYGKNLSFYKALKNWIKSFGRFKEAFWNGMEAVINFLIKFLGLSYRKYMLEKRKHGNYSPEIVQGIIILRIEGKAIPCAA